jgi:NIPSNAP
LLHTQAGDRTPLLQRLRSARLENSDANPRPSYLIGYFHTEIGELNQVVHLWGYESLAERERRRALLAADPEWQEYLKNSPDIVVKMESRILVPAPFSPIK